MKPVKVITESMILNAMKHTNSNTAAAKYLRISFPTYSNYAKTYLDPSTGKTLFELHSNKQGKGVSKPRINTKVGEQVLRDFLEKGVNVSHYNINKIKKALIHYGLLSNECCKCSYHEKRVVDNKVPLLLSFKDGDKRNATLNNLELLCYNCYFLYVGDIFTKRQVKVLEDINSADVQKGETDWELDIDLEKLLQESTPNTDLSGDEYISRY